MLFRNPWQIPDESDDNILATSEAVPEVSSTKQAQRNGWLDGLTESLPTLSSLLAAIPLERAQDLSPYGISATKVVIPEFGASRKKQTVKATWLGHAVSDLVVASSIRAWVDC